MTATAPAQTRILTEEETWNIVNGAAELRVSVNTGGFEALRSDWWWAIDWENPPNVPEDFLAAQLAQDALAQSGLLPTGAELWGVRTAVQATESSDTNAGASIDSVFPVHKQVVFRRMLGGAPVFGPGGEMSVCVGPFGIERINRNAWRKVAPAGQTPIIPLAEALDALAQQGADATLLGLGAPVEQVVVVDAQLAYYEFEDDVEQTTLRPVWYLWGLGTLPEGGEVPLQLVVEADTPPIVVQIDGAGGGEEIAPGAEVCAVANVAGGVPPYHFRWTSGVEGLVGEGPQLCYVPTLVDDPDRDETAKHALTVEVTDAEGRVRRDRVTLCFAAIDDVPGDATGDGLVNIEDLNAVLASFGQSVEPGTGGDVTGDGTVNIEDLNEVLANFGG